MWQHLLSGRRGMPFMCWEWVQAWGSNLPKHVTPIVATGHDDRGLSAAGLFVLEKGRRAGGIVPTRVLHCGETGRDELDEVSIEYAGLLSRPGNEEESCRAIFGELIARHPGLDAFLFRATDQAATIAAASPGGWRAMVLDARRDCMVDLAELRRAGGAYIDALPATRRAKLRKVQRKYGELGEVTVSIAGSRAEKSRFFAGLSRFHLDRWAVDGQRNAFQIPFFEKVVGCLLDQADAHGPVHLAHVQVGEHSVGYQLNLIEGRDVYFYNAGLNYEIPNPKAAEPGFLMHQAMIEHYLQAGFDRYHFMVGNQRYKRDLATYERTVYTIRLQRTRMIFDLEDRLRRLLGRPRLISASDMPSLCSGFQPIT